MDVNLLLGWARITCPTRYNQTGRFVDGCLFTLKGCVGVVRWHERGFYVWNSEFGSNSNFKLWDLKMWETNGSYGACDFCSLIISLHDTSHGVDLQNFDDNSSLNRMAMACVDTTSSAHANYNAKTRNPAWTLVISAFMCEEKCRESEKRERISTVSWLWKIGQLRTYLLLLLLPAEFLLDDSRCRSWLLSHAKCSS